MTTHTVHTVSLNTLQLGDHISALPGSSGPKCSAAGEGGGEGGRLAESSTSSGEKGGEEREGGEEKRRERWRKMQKNAVSEEQRSGELGAGEQREGQGGCFSVSCTLKPKAE